MKIILLLIIVLTGCTKKIDEHYYTPTFNLSALIIYKAPNGIFACYDKDKDKKTYCVKLTEHYIKE